MPGHLLQLHGYEQRSQQRSGLEIQPGQAKELHLLSSITNAYRSRERPTEKRVLHFCNQMHETFVHSDDTIFNHSKLTLSKSNL